MCGTHQLGGIGNRRHLDVQLDAEREGAVLATVEQDREDETFHAGWAVLAMEAFFDVGAADGVRAGYEFRADDEVFHVRVADGAVEAAHGPAQLPDATLATTEQVLIELAEGRTTFADAIKSKQLRAAGDKEAVRRLRTLFRWPSPSARVASQNRE